MLKAVIGGLFGATLLSSSAMAVTCSAYPYTFSSGSTAVATQVNDNFTSILNCANNNLVASSGGTLTGGTLAGNTNLPGGGKITGSLGLGMTPINILDITDNSTNPTISLLSTNAGTSAYEQLFFSNGTGIAIFRHYGANYTTSGINRQDGTQIFGGGSGGLTLSAGAAQPIYLTINGAEVARLDTSGRLGIGTSSPGERLEVNGRVKISTFASAAATTICQNANVLSSCSSSIRYKENVKSATFGLDQIMKLRPVTFKWKGRDENDLGFIAEEVEKIDPLFVTYKDGQIEGVKYPQLTAVLANAVRELKAANDKVVAENTELKSRLDKNEQRLTELELRAGIRTAANDNLLTKVAAVFGW